MNILEFFLYFLVPSIVAGIFFLKRKLSFFEVNGIPHDKPSLLFGNVKGVGTTLHFADLIRNTYIKFKGKDVIAGFYNLFTPTIIVTDLDLVRQITIKDFNNFMDRGFFENEKDEPLTGNMFSMEGEKWRFLRNKLSPAFTSGQIKMMYNTISDKGEHFVKAIDSACKLGSVDMKEMSSRFTIDVISSCAFGMETNTLSYEHPEVVRIFKQIFGKERLYIQFFIFFFPNLAKFLQVRQFPKVVSDFFTDVISGSIRQREADNIVRKDFLNMLIQLKNKGSIENEISTETRKLTMNECIAEAFIFFFAGADTSSTVISYALTELSHNQEIQEKLRKEVLEKTKSSNGKITYDNLNEMNYLNHVVNETLRKYPPAFILIRKAKEDYKIPDSKHVIPKGTQIMIPTGGIHYDEAYWKNPEEFDPDRFTAEEVAKRPNMSFLPFGEGPRNCIGMRFAMVNVKFAIATAIKNFKITLDEEKTVMPLKLDATDSNFTPLGGFWINFERL